MWALANVGREEKIALKRERERVAQRNEYTTPGRASAPNEVDVAGTNERDSNCAFQKMRFYGSLFPSKRRASDATAAPPTVQRQRTSNGSDDFLLECISYSERIAMCAHEYGNRMSGTCLH